MKSTYFTWLDVILILTFLLLSVDLFIFTRSHDHQVANVESYTSNYSNNFCECKPLSKTKSRILNGTTVNENDLKWVASVFKETMAQKTRIRVHLCTGTVIAASWVITSSNCFVRTLEKDWESEKKLLYVAAGQSHNMPKAYQNVKNFRKVENIFIHPNYSISKEILAYDIAIIKLEVPFELGDDIYPACLSELHRNNFEKEQLFVSGFGKTKNASNEVIPFPGGEIQAEDELKMIYLEQIPNCSKTAKKINESVSICTRSRKSSVFAGDTGAPLHFLYQNKLQVIGILNIFSWEINSPKVSIFTLVEPYLDWIDSHNITGRCLKGPHFEFDHMHTSYFVLIIFATGFLSIFIFLYIKNKQDNLRIENEMNAETIPEKKNPPLSSKISNKKAPRFIM